MTGSPITVEVVDYRVEWPAAFAARADAIRTAIGDTALRIDHIGSTSVPGLAAKPIIDVQIAVADWSRFGELRAGMEGLGYLFWPDNEDRRKRYFTLDGDGMRLVNVHTRLWAGFSAQAALLFRDYLRHDDAARDRYEAVKRELARRTWPTIDSYADAKGDVIWASLRAADVWAWEEAWSPGPPDA